MNVVLAVLIVIGYFTGLVFGPDLVAWLRRPHDVDEWTSPRDTWWIPR